MRRLRGQTVTASVSAARVIIASGCGGFRYSAGAFDFIVSYFC